MAFLKKFQDKYKTIDNPLPIDWEDKLRAKLQSQKKHVIGLTLDLYGYVLTVDHLERVLSEAEELRKAGGDPSLPIQQQQHLLPPQNEVCRLHVCKYTR